ncbi:MAG: DUF4129 domain-containing protein [Candidatus Sulfotelmatobacter sp.]
MTATRTCILAGLLIAGLTFASLFCRADAGQSDELTVAEYRAQLDQLLLATQQLDSSGRPVPPALKELPQVWRVRTGNQSSGLEHLAQTHFEVPTEGLRRDVRRFEQERSITNATAIRSRIQVLRNDLDAFDAAPPDVSSQRERLTSLLARREFRDVHGPTFTDRLKQKLVAMILRALEFLFRSSAIPTVSKFFVYGLIGLAVLALGFVAYRQILSASEQEGFVPTDIAVSAKSWALWLAEAQAAAQQHNWREAIHLAYWAGISFLERQGTWRPDRARTPREYLKLLSSASEHRETLAALTRVFELAWYAKREADAEAFAQTLKALERLGCHSS